MTIGIKKEKRMKIEDEQRRDHIDMTDATRRHKTTRRQ